MRALPACLLAVAALACNRGSTTNEGAAASSAVALAAPSAAPAPSSAAAASTLANATDNASCALVTKAEAEAILGQPLQDLTVAYNGMCEYRPLADLGKKAAMMLVEVKIYPNETKQTFESETQNAANILHATRKPRADLGEAAYEINDYQFMVLQHGKAISVARLKSLESARFEAFAKKAASRL
jgi:hypothetical protein